MKILSHPDIRQIDEKSDDSGKLFAPTFLLHGERTLPEVWSVMTKQLIQPILEDFRREIYQLAFIHPEHVVTNDRLKTITESEAILGRFQGNRIFHEDDRAEQIGKYYPLCLHNHPLDESTSSLNLTDGDLSTLFFYDQQEIYDLMTDLLRDEYSDLAATFREEMPKMTGTIPEYVSALTILLLDKFSKSTGHLHERIRYFQICLKTKLKCAVESKPQVGKLAVFGGNVTHSTGMRSAYSIEDPGEILAWHSSKGS